jgi:pyruvate formate lyase activating enzyme
MDAANVDLKFSNDVSYKKICAGGLKPVQESIKFMRANNIWVEVTTLVVPGKNDSEAELRHISQFIAGVDANIPWHISKFFPNYQYSAYDPTPDGSLRKAFEIGRESGLRFIYAGNVSGWGGSTYCPFCKKLLVKREGLTILEENLDYGRCKFCQAQIPGVY